MKMKKKKRKEIKKLILLLVPAKVNFVEMPTDTSVPVGTEAMLKCVTSSRVEKCTWFWKPLHGNEPEIVIEEYPSNGDLGRDCSFTFPKVYIEKQGQWACQVSIGSLNTILTSPYAKLTVFEQGIFIFVNVLQFPPPLVQGNGETFSLLFLLLFSIISNTFQFPDDVKFSELSKDIQITAGGSVFLHCVTSSAVEQCRWSLTPVNSNTTVVVKQFPAAGSEARDCSVRLTHALAEQEGLWTCGARIRGRQNYTDAPPAKLSLLEPGIIES